MNARGDAEIAEQVTAVIPITRASARAKDSSARSAAPREMTPFAGRPTTLPELSNAFSRVVATRRSTSETGCSAAWGLDFGQHGDAGTEILAAPALARWPDNNQILIWLAAPVADAHAVRAAAAPLLVREEEVAAMALHNPADQCASLAAHAGLRLMLGTTMGVPPSGVRIHRGPHGKPLLDRDDLYFSLAHVRGAIAVALARRPVGIDIERKAALPDLDRIAETAFAPESGKALANVEGVARLEMFYRFWTLGEALIKATGLGIFQGLDSFAFTPDGEPRLTRVSSPWGPAERWRFGFC